MVHKLAGGDLSDPAAEFVVADVPRITSVFQVMTFELAKINLKGLAAKGLGALMGAVTWNFPAGSEGDPVKSVDKGREAVYFDSRTAKRTVLGRMCNGDLCCAPE